MEISQKHCRLCVSETEFNVYLFSEYCRKRNTLHKIKVCLNLTIEDADRLLTICYKCADSVEKYYEFVTLVKQSQAKIKPVRDYQRDVPVEKSIPRNYMKSQLTFNGRQQAEDPDFSFSFLEMVPPHEDKKSRRSSSPIFSYFSPPNPMLTHSKIKEDTIQEKEFHKPYRHLGSDNSDYNIKSLKMTSNNAIIKKLRERCFGLAEF